MICGLSSFVKTTTDVKHKCHRNAFANESLWLIWTLHRDVTNEFKAMGWLKHPDVHKTRFNKHIIIKETTWIPFNLHLYPSMNPHAVLHTQHNSTTKVFKQASNYIQNKLTSSTDKHWPNQYTSGRLRKELKYKLNIQQSSKKMDTDPTSTTFCIFTAVHTKMCVVYSYYSIFTKEN